ncbi:MAG: ABC transporter substrate-binding protein [Solobacterium sp.]|nr:ABC transporter substrate-binding protein [Solobacterium sp.]
MNKKLLAALLAAAMLAGCGGSKPASGTDSGNTSTGTEATAAAESAKTADSTPTGGSVEGTPATEQMEKVVVAINSASTDASPYAMNTPSRANTKEPLYATLFYIAPGHFIEDIQPFIGKTVTQVDDYTWDIEIFDNVTDSKGNKITANDVLWSYDYSFRNQEFLVYGTDVEYFKVIDDTHLQLKTTKTIPGVIEKLLCNAACTIVNQEWYENAPDEEKQNDPATTGRYMVEKNVSGSEIVLVANDDYWQKDETMLPDVAKANVKRIYLKVITEDSMRAIALENKEVDVARITATNLHRFYENGAAKEGYNVFMGITSPTLHSAWLNMDPNGPSKFAKDVNLRKAALYALNSEDFMLASGNTFDTAILSKASTSPKSEGYNPAWDDPSYDYFNYDPEKAKEYLHEAGYKDGECEIKVLMSISLYSDSQQAVVIAGLEEAGFKVNLLAVDQALFLNYRFENDQWDMIFDVKLAGDSAVTGWDNLYNPVGYSNGSVCFTHDDKLVELLNNAVKDASQENVEAFNTYLTENAIQKGLYTMMTMCVAQDGILEMNISNATFNPQGSTYAADFVSAPGAH